MPAKKSRPAADGGGSSTSAGGKAAAIPAGGGTRTRFQLPYTLPQLQNLIKRDRDAYAEEFQQQWRHYEAKRQILMLRPDKEDKEFGELVNFISAVAHCFPETVREFPEQIKDVLLTHHRALAPELRQALCRALILLRNRDLITSTSLLELFFQLFACPDKALRTMLYSHIVSDIRRINLKHKQNTINKTLQNFMYTMLSRSEKMAATKSLEAMIELYRKGIWNDAKTVNVVATALFHSETKIRCTAIRFFLGHDEPIDDGDEDDEGAPDAAYQSMLQKNERNKKSKKRQRKLAKALNIMHKKERKKDKPVVFNFSAIHLLHDPQSLAEKLFQQLKSSNDSFEIRLMQMNLISRLVGIHQLMLFNFYPFLQRYAQPHQREVTLILTYLAQSSHELVPGDVLEPILVSIANNFVNERSSPEGMAVGINAVREICIRCPLAMNETLLQDLIQYKNHKDKSVTVAARSLLALYREVNPSLLHKRDRGKPGEHHDADVKAAEYAELRPASFVPGTELLSMLEDAAAEGGEGGAAADVAAAVEEEMAGWETASDESDDDDEAGWIDVQHSDDEKDMEEDGDEPAEDKVVKDTVDAEERKRRAMQLTASRILTQEDFEKIKILRAQRRLNPAVARKRAAADEEEDRPEVLDPMAIIPARKKARQDKEERLQSVLEGREGRGKFNVRKGRQNEHASTTNREKSKKKNPLMLLHARSVRAKKKASMWERQMKRAGKRRRK